MLFNASATHRSSRLLRRAICGAGLLALIESVWISPLRGAEEIAADRPNATAESAADDPPASKLDAKFADGWRKEVALTDPNGGDKTPHCVAWVDDGWLVVERRDTAGEVEWQIVLAQVGEEDEPPTIEPNPAVPGGLRLTYRDGRFFIRDDWGHLRCLRQKKTADMPWPALEIPPDEVHPSGMVLGGGNKLGEKEGRLYGRRNGGWQFVARGWEGELAEYVLRMYCLEVGAFRLGSRSDRGGVTYTVGEQLHSVQSSTLSDDGELFVAARMHEWLVNLHRDQLKKLLDNRKKIVGAAPPAIFAAKWLNGDAVPLDDLKGKPALVYFAGDYSKRVADQLSAIDNLFGKYRDRGLEVAAVIAADDEELYAAICEKRGWRFPLAVDHSGGPGSWGGPAAQRFSVTDTPCYFLIGRDGKIAVGLYQERVPLGSYKRPPPLPDDAEIQNLLGVGDQ